MRKAGGDGAACPRPRPRPRPRPCPLGPGAMCEIGWVQVERGQGPVDGGRGLGRRAGGHASPPPSLLGEAARVVRRPSGPLLSLVGGGGSGAGGGGGLRPPSRSRPALVGAAVPRRLCPLSYRQPPTAAWGPAPLPGLTPCPRGGTQCHRLAPGRPRGLWAYRPSPAGPGVWTLGPPQVGGVAGAGTAAVTTARPRRARPLGHRGDLARRRRPAGWPVGSDQSR